MSNSSLDNRKFDAIVCFSAIDWDFLWQRTQEIMSQFAAMGYPILFVENTGIRAPTVNDLPRIFKRMRSVLGSQRNFSETDRSEGVDVVSPMVIPFPYNKFAVKFNATIITRQIEAFSRRHKVPISRMLLWSYMTTPLAAQIASNLPWAEVVVDIVSDPCKVRGAEDIAPSHHNMLRIADIVLCASVPVVNSTKHYMGNGKHGKIHLFEDGFSTQLQTTAEQEFEQTKPLSKNPDGELIAAFIGGVNDKIWWEAVTVMAEAFPEIRFVFAGPREVGALPGEERLNNLFWQPPFKKYSDIGCFLKKVKVGLIPYTPTPYVMEMRPAKINEYLVMGLPIVATNLPELERLGKEEGPGIVYLAGTVEEFKRVLNDALVEDCEEYRKKRWEIVERRSWVNVCRELESILQRSI